MENKILMLNSTLIKETGDEFDRAMNDLNSSINTIRQQLYSNAWLWKVSYCGCTIAFVFPTQLVCTWQSIETVEQTD